MDSRERVVAACDFRDSTREQIAARFSVSVRWIGDLLKREPDIGRLSFDLPGATAAAVDRPGKDCRQR